MRLEYPSLFLETKNMLLQFHVCLSQRYSDLCILGIARALVFGVRGPTMFTLPETNSLPLKIGHPKRKLVFQPSNFRCYVSFKDGTVSVCDCIIYHLHPPSIFHCIHLPKQTMSSVLVRARPTKRYSFAPQVVAKHQ